MGRLDSRLRNSRLGWSDLDVSFGMVPSTKGAFMKAPVLRNILAAVLGYVVMFAVAFAFFSLPALDRLQHANRDPPHPTRRP